MEHSSQVSWIIEHIWQIAWLVVFLRIAVLETWALVRKKRGDTLSEQVIPQVLATRARRMITLTIWIIFIVWVTWHWWFQYWSNGQYVGKT